MSHPHYWAEIDYQGAALAGTRRANVGPARNAEKLSVTVPIGSRSAILGDPVERNFRQKAENREF